MVWVIPWLSTNKYGKSSPFIVFSLKWLENLPLFHLIALKTLALPLPYPRLGGSKNTLCVMLLAFAEILLAVLKLGVLSILALQKSLFFLCFPCCSVSLSLWLMLFESQTKFQDKIILMARLRHIAIFRTQPTMQVYKPDSKAIFLHCAIRQSPRPEMLVKSCILMDSSLRFYFVQTISRPI